MKVLALLTAEQVAELLHIRPRSVRGLGIPAVRVGRGRGVLRYREQDVESYVSLRVEYQGLGGNHGRRIPKRARQVGLSVLPSRERSEERRVGKECGVGRV